MQWVNFIFDNFTHYCHECCSSLIVKVFGKLIVTIHKALLECKFFNSEYTRYCCKALRGHSYQASPSLSISRTSIFLKKATKPMTVKLVDTGISSLKTVFSCYLYLAQHLSHFFSLNISQLGTGRPLRPDSQFSTFITKRNWNTWLW